MPLLTCKFFRESKNKNCKKKKDFSRQTKLVSVSKMRRYDYKLNLKKEKKDLLSKMLCHPILLQRQHTSFVFETKRSCQTIIAFENTSACRNPILKLWQSKCYHFDIFRNVDKTKDLNKNSGQWLNPIKLRDLNPCILTMQMQRV